MKLPRKIQCFEIHVKLFWDTILFYISGARWRSWGICCEDVAVTYLWNRSQEAGPRKMTHPPISKIFSPLIRFIFSRFYSVFIVIDSECDINHSPTTSHFSSPISCHYSSDLWTCMKVELCMIQLVFIWVVKHQVFIHIWTLWCHTSRRHSWDSPNGVDHQSVVSLDSPNGVDHQSVVSKPCLLYAIRTPPDNCKYVQINFI